jgi:hypothetical protein
MKARWSAGDEPRSIPEDKWTEAKAVFDDLFTEGVLSRLSDPFEGTKVQRRRLRQVTAVLISRYVQDGVSVVEEGGRAYVRRSPGLELEVTLLKELVWELSRHRLFERSSWVRNV